MRITKQSIKGEILCRTGAMVPGILSGEKYVKAITYINRLFDRTECKTIADMQYVVNKYGGKNAIALALIKKLS